MTIVDQGTDAEDMLPPRRAPKGPAPVRVPVEFAFPAAPAGEGDEAKPKTQPKTKRPPLARGTVLLGGTAVAGTLLALVAASGGALALVATAAGTVMVPMAAWSARNAGNSRSRQHRQNRRNGNPFGWWPGGTGGGGRRTAGLGSGGAGRSRAGGGGGVGRTRTPSASGGMRMPRMGGGTGSRARAGGVVPRQRTAGSGGSRVRTPRVGGTGRQPTSGRLRPGQLAGTGGRRTRGGVLPGVGRGRHTGAIPARGRHGVNPRVRGGINPAAGKVPRGKVSGGGIGKPAKGSKGTAPAAGRSGVMRSAGRALGAMIQRESRGAGRAAILANAAGYRAGRSFRRGMQKPTGRTAFAKAYQHYGRKGHPKTVTGYAGRLVGGAIAGASAGTIRFFVNQAKKAARSIQAAYTSPKPATATQPMPQSGPPQPPVQPAGPHHQQHPVPPPAFAQPQPAPAGNPAPATTPAAQPVGASTGGSSDMSHFIAGMSSASDFFSACVKFHPVEAINGRMQGSIWPLETALPNMSASINLIANGFQWFYFNTQTDLHGGLDPVLAGVMGEVRDHLARASVDGANMLPVFRKVYEEALRRRAMRGGQALNV